MARVYYKKGHPVVWTIVMILVILLVVGLLGWGTQGFSDWKFSNWFKDETTDVTPPDEDDPNGDIVMGDETGPTSTSLAVYSISPEDFDTYDVVEGSLSAYVVIATVVGGTSQELEWSLDWKATSYGTVSDYVVLDISSDTLSATLSCIAPFGETLVLSACSVIDSSVGDSLDLDYLASVSLSAESLLFSYGENPVLSLTDTYGVGSLIGDLSLVDYSITLSQEFLNAYDALGAVQYTEFSWDDVIRLCTPVDNPAYISIEVLFNYLVPDALLEFFPELDSAVYDTLVLYSSAGLLTFDYLSVFIDYGTFDSYFLEGEFEAFCQWLLVDIVNMFNQTGMLDTLAVDYDLIVYDILFSLVEEDERYDDDMPFYSCYQLFLEYYDEFNATGMLDTLAVDYDLIVYDILSSLVEEDERYDDDMSFYSCVQIMLEYYNEFNATGMLDWLCDSSHYDIFMGLDESAFAGLDSYDNLPEDYSLSDVWKVFLEYYETYILTGIVELSFVFTQTNDLLISAFEDLGYVVDSELGLFEDISLTGYTEIGTLSMTFAYSYGDYSETIDLTCPIYVSLIDVAPDSVSFDTQGSIVFH